MQLCMQQKEEGVCLENNGLSDACYLILRMGVNSNACCDLLSLGDVIICKFFVTRSAMNTLFGFGIGCACER
jgi:hypothetical protein